MCKGRCLPSDPLRTVSLEAGMWGRSHQRLGKIPGASPSRCHTGPRECLNSKHINSCKVSHWLWEMLNRQFSYKVRTTYFPSGFDAVHHGHTDVENYQIELSSLTFSNACLPFSASSQIPRESRVRRNRIPRRIASRSLTIRIDVRRHSRLPRPTTLREPLDPWPQPGQTRCPSLRRTGYGSHHLQRRSSLSNLRFSG